MGLPNEFGVIVNCAVGRGILDKCAENRIIEFHAHEVVDLDGDAERFRARLDDLDRLRMTIVGDEKRFAIGNRRVAKRHRFGGGGGFVEERRVSDVELGKIDNHGLEIEQRLEPALRDFGLIRRVSGVPTGILENVSLDDWRRDATGVARADEGFRELVLF